MATGAFAGYKGFVWAGPSTGSTLKIAELRDWNITYEMSEIDATSHDSSGYRENIAGIRGWSGSAGFLYISASSGQTQLHDLLDGGTLATMQFYPQGTSSGFPFYSGSGYFTNWGLAGPNEDVIDGTVDFVGTGALTQSTSS
jgi:predicted secreted protein